jgi:hypothetical protein
MIIYWNGKVHPKRNVFQRIVDWILGRKWVLVASVGPVNQTPSMVWYEKRGKYRGSLRQYFRK